MDKWDCHATTKRVLKTTLIEHIFREGVCWNRVPRSFCIVFILFFPTALCTLLKQLGSNTKYVRNLSIDVKCRKFDGDISVGDTVWNMTLQRAILSSDSRRWYNKGPARRGHALYLVLRNVSAEVNSIVTSHQRVSCEKSQVAAQRNRTDHRLESHWAPGRKSSTRSCCRSIFWRSPSLNPRVKLSSSTIANRDSYLFLLTRRNIYINAITPK